jgi:hypothetical protein
MLQGIPVTYPPSSSIHALLVTIVTSHLSNVWSSTRDIEFGVDVSPLFYSIVVLDSVTTSSSLFNLWSRTLFSRFPNHLSLMNDQDDVVTSF